MTLFLICLCLASIIGTVVILFPMGSLLSRHLDLTQTNMVVGYCLVVLLAIFVPLLGIFAYGDLTSPDPQYHDLGVAIGLTATAFVSLFTVPMSVLWFRRNWSKKVEAGLYETSH